MDPDAHKFNNNEPCSTIKILCLRPTTAATYHPQAARILPFLNDIISVTPLRNGLLSEKMRHAIFIPRRKKASANPSDIGSDWPVSNITFMSKVAERL